MLSIDAMLPLLNFNQSSLAQSAQIAQDDPARENQAIIDGLFAKPSSDVVVDLSPAAELTSNLLSSQPESGDTSSSDFMALMQGVQQQILDQGTNATVLTELPPDASEARTNLAKQAANYLLVGFYGDQSRYADASAQDPFANLNGNSLSRIALDTTGTFTPVERQVAFFDLSSRGSQEPFNARAPLGEQASWDWVPDSMENAGIIDATSNDTGAPTWSDEPWDETARLLAQLSPVTPPPFAGSNALGLPNSAFGIVPESGGNSEWSSITAKQLDPEELSAGVREQLDDSLLAQAVGNSSPTAQVALQLSLYQLIDSYRDV